MNKQDTEEVNGKWNENKAEEKWFSFLHYLLLNKD